jgi:hypothetical protein
MQAQGFAAVTGVAERTPRHMPRLSELLFRSSCRGFETLAPLPSNLHAIESSLLFVNGVLPAVALLGPSGWGKSHILEAVAASMSRNGESKVHVFTASEWLPNMNRIDPQLPLILDNVQEALDRCKLRLQLRLALERRVKAGRPTMLSFTADKASRQIRALLPNGRAWTIAQVNPPAQAERSLVVRQMSKAEGLVLSDSLIDLLGHKIGGNGRTLAGALNRLKLNQQRWLDDPMVLRACGILNPFFADNSSWDLRVHILDVAEREMKDLDPEFKRDISLYTMLRVALLSEDEVARFFEVEPAQAYARASKVEQRLRTCEESCRTLHTFIEKVVSALASH